jgi:hypothetical protein
MSARWDSHLDLKVTQPPFEALAAGVVILPAGEVADLAGSDEA